MSKKCLGSLILGLGIFTLLGLLNFSLYAKPSKDAIKPGMDMPHFTLDLSEQKKAKEYLGLTEIKPFSLPEIPAKLILVDVLSSTWGVCIENQPVVNRLYYDIEKDPVLSKDVKMLAISMADNPKKVRKYQKTFKVPYPIFSDEDLSIYFKLGRTGTPALILTTREGKVLWFHYGAIDSPEQVISVMKKFLKE